MALTEEEKKILEILENSARQPRKPIVTSNPGKFTDNVLVPASEYVDWHKIADKGMKRPAKSTRSKRSDPAK